MSTTKKTANKPKRQGNYTRARTDVDWESVERHYRAGVASKAELARMFSISRAALDKRADAEGWTRNVQEKVEQSTADKVMRKVAADLVTPEVTSDGKGHKKLSESVVVEAYSEVSAVVDTTQRSDVKKALDAQRRLLEELVALSQPGFSERLEWLGQIMDESGPDPETGRMVRDKVNEAYRYIVSLDGRVKLAKDIAAAYQVYITLQRKMFKLDSEDKTGSTFEDLLAKLGASAAKE
jgi:hypothetical protein